MFIYFIGGPFDLTKKQVDGKQQLREIHLLNERKRVDQLAFPKCSAQEIMCDLCLYQLSYKTEEGSLIYVYKGILYDTK